MLRPRGNGKGPRAWINWRVAAELATIPLLAAAIHGGWTRLSTDFPNYYTAAVLVRTGQHDLREYYDWTWFERQMNYAGIETQLGAYTPQTPLTMLPMVGLSVVAPLPAKRIWLILNVGFLATTTWMLSRVTRFNMGSIWLLAFCGYLSMYSNFLYGQYYLFLLFLLTLTFYALHREKTASSGLLAGIAFALKLYGGPLLLYFLARRMWKAVLGTVAALTVAGAFAIWVFGWAGVDYYLVQVLPRTLEGGSINPYDPGVQTFSTMLRHLFVREPELNPHPAFEVPRLFFFLRTLGNLAILTFVTLSVAGRPTCKRRDFAWFLIAILFLSTSTGSYSYILLLLPLILILEDSAPWQSGLWIAWYMLLTLPPHPAWLFPKVWLLLAAFIALGWERWSAPHWQWMFVAAVLIVAIAWGDARRQMLAYEQEPGQRFERVVVEVGAVFSGFPAVSRAGLFYQSMRPPRYALSWLHDNRVEQLPFAGHALRPAAPAADGPTYFELVAQGRSQIMQFDPSTRRTVPTLLPTLPVVTDSAMSPDGSWVAFARNDTHESKQLWLRNVASRNEERLTGGNCNSSSPAWELDSRAVVFASDCGRAFGLPALYRAPVKR